MLNVAVLDSGDVIGSAIRNAAKNVGIDVVMPIIGAEDIADVDEWARQNITESVDYLVLTLGCISSDYLIYPEKWLLDLKSYCLVNNVGILVISSSAVLSNSSANPVSESDDSVPATAFGKYCHSIELLFEDMPRCLILRAGWLFGSTVGGWFHNIVAAIQAGNELDFPPDQIGHPTSCNDIARVIVGLIEQLDCTNDPELWSTYHYGSSDAVSKQRFCQVIINEMARFGDFSGLQLNSTPYDPGNSQECFGQNGALDCTKILYDFAIKQRSWVKDVVSMLSEQFVSDEIA